MKLLKHYSIGKKANSYIYGPENGGDALLIDPGVMDIHMLDLIEDNNFYITGILITHAHKSHIESLRTIMKIYDATIYSFYSHIDDFDTQSLVDGESIQISNFLIDVINIPGHSPDSLVFKIDNLLFVGDVISAGLLGSTQSKLEENLLIDSIEAKLLTLNDNLLVLPGHGPPSVLGTEKKMFNLYSNSK